MEKYGLLEEHEMDSIIADSNEKTVASDVASSATAGAAAAGCSCFICSIALLCMGQSCP